MYLTVIWIKALISSYCFAKLKQKRFESVFAFVDGVVHAGK